MKTSLCACAAFAILATFSLADSDGKECCPFNGKDLTGWAAKKDSGKENKWAVGEAALSTAKSGQLDVKPGGAALVNNVAGHAQGQDLHSEQKFGDMHLELEVMVPKGSNSGVYVMGEYEVQVLDSYGKADKDMSPGDIGAIYSAAVPKTNASKAPGEWQKFVIDFKAPKFDASGKKTENAKFVRVELNGKVLHENVEMKGPTPGGVTGQEHAQGPIMFQGNHGAVAYRNIKVSPLK
jgi:hypothetical protein